MTAHSYTRLCVVWAILLFSFVLSNPARAARDDFCGVLPAAGFDQPPNQARAGVYDNAEYGYRVTIPAALKAFVSAHGPERGFGVLLSSKPRAYLRVDASYDAFYDITALGVHRSDLTTIRLRDSVVDDQSEDIRLALREGGRYRTRVRCAGNAQIFVYDQVIVLVNREIYRLALQTIPERYDDDVKVLNQMLQSWQWQRPTPRNPSGR